MAFRIKGLVDYGELLQAGPKDHAEFVSFLLAELPYVWKDAYHEMTSRPVNIVRWKYGTFEYLFDDYASLEATNSVPYDKNVEARLVGALGISDPRDTARDDYRLKGWIGATERVFGRGWDKGHFIAHSLGGKVDGLEANVFIQRRDLNRGWSLEGKRFREMEQYCQENRGTFCFSRPLYTDETARPSFIEFGILKPDRALSVECFTNYHPES